MLGHRKAAEMLERLRAVAGLRAFHIDAEVERKGWEFFLREGRRGISPGRAMNFGLRYQTKGESRLSVSWSDSSAEFVVVK